MALLPTIMELFSKILKPSHRGQHEIAIMSRFYACLVFMIMLVTVMASTFLSGGSNIVDYFKNFTENIEHIADLLGEGLASMSIYFLLYILLNTFMTLPKEVCCFMQMCILSTFSSVPTTTVVPAQLSYL